MSLPDGNIKDLICPLGKVALRSENNNLVCSKCGVKFPVIDGIPFLLIDDAILPEGIESVSGLKCLSK